MKIALVHDFLNQYGGAEKVLEALHEIYPEAPLFTSLYLPDRLPDHFRSWDIRTSFMQRLPFLDPHFKKYILLYPRAIERFDLQDYDVVLSSSSAFAKGALVRTGARHICYCYTPMRFVWNQAAYLEKERIHPLYKMVLPPVLEKLKRWDLKTVGRVHHYVAISEYIRNRIRQAYGRDSEIVYPPVDTAQFSIASRTEDYYLVISRLNAYKRLDMVIEAFNRLSRPLRIIGVGPQEAELKKMAGPSVQFLGRVSQAELGDHLARCRAFIFPGEEDFGIAPVEAMASGRPVVAFGAGGALETVLEGETGLFFREPTPESLEQAVHRLDSMSFDPLRLRRHAEKFDKAVFQRKIREVVEGIRSGSLSRG